MDWKQSSRVATYRINAKYTAICSDLFDQEFKEHYAGWLDAQLDRSVVYIFFESYVAPSP
ncbi:hypothetical protein Taro_019152 [Colocasia esculenta]|uniref:Uncharacterized protein n=1 Tax=Colocasia esculenta TaxID=4460 RepID=A0A843UKF4_COLES|nr:hypothetical protein [Colocasia esculenta]